MTTRGYNQPSTPAPENDTAPSLERLVAELSLGARSAVNVMLAGSVEAARWEELNDVIHHRVRTFAHSDERHEIETAVINRALADLHRREPERADAFAALAADLDGWRESWGRAVDQPILDGCKPACNFDPCSGVIGVQI